MTRISTHVLDTATGRPAVGVPVRLERLEQSGNWLALNSTQTDGDGRCRELLPAPAALSEGLYHLVFDTRTYFASQRVTGLYPFIEVAFAVRAGESHFHIPLLLSPHGYTTYRGS